MKARCFKMLVSIFAIGTMCLACSKDNNDEKPLPDDPIISPTTGTRKQLTLDSIYNYARQVYLWHDVLPSYEGFAPRENYASLSPDITAFEKELFDLTQLAINPATNLPYEKPVSNGVRPKYAYISTTNSTGSLAANESYYTTTVPYHLIAEHGNAKVGYVVIQSLPALQTEQTVFDRVFADFADKGVTELIVDLRNNGGGYVETSEYLANLIASSSLNKKTMFSQNYNDKLQNGQATILQFQPYHDANGKTVDFHGRMGTLYDVDYTAAKNTFYFEKKGTLNGIKQVVFIVSSHTASAAELLISTLKPYYPVSLVGETTYGKPVGFFSIKIDEYYLNLPSFELKNSQGWSDYYEGMEPDIAVTNLASNPTWGASDESGLSAAFSALDGKKLSGKAQTNKKKQQQNTSVKKEKEAVPAARAIPIVRMKR